VILVDTSLWVEVFRKRDPLRIESLFDFDEIVTCLPVVAEVLQGFRDDRAYRTAREALFAMPIVESPLRSEVFEEGAQLYRSARRAGLTIRSGVACLIASCAIRNNLTLAHRDRYFDLLARVAPLAVDAV